MAEGYGFNEDYILGDGLGALTRHELLELAREVCRRLMEVEGDCHGGIHRGNISRTSAGEVGLGPKPDHAPGDWSSDELEFMAPELFWDHAGDAAADVYSVGLLLYAGCCGGRLPFFPDGGGKPTPSDRAAALRRRMSGEIIPVPVEAGEKLGAVIARALSYDAAARYSGPVELLAALSECPDEETPAAAAAPIPTEDIGTVPPAAPAAKEPPRPEYRVDKQFEDRLPKKKKKSGKPVIVVAALCAALIILALAVRGCNGTGQPSETTPTAGISPSAEVSPSASVSPEVSPSASPEVTPTATPTPTPTPTPSPTPTPTPTPTSAASSYEITLSDLSWTAAADKCIAKGGHLVTISDEAEFQKVTQMADEAGAKFVWIGCFRKQGSFVWLNNETGGYFKWAAGEPSVTDSDGTAENFCLLWNKDGEGWVYNDSRDDPASDYPGVYGGKIAYICEYN